MVPVGVLELVLDVEQPDPDRGGQKRDRQLHQEEALDADQRAHADHDPGDGEVGRHRADPDLLAAVHQLDRQAMLEQEQVDRAERQQDQRVAQQSVAEPPPARQAEVLGHRKRGDVARAAAVEIARGGVMDGVAAPPVVVGRERQHADRPADPVVGQRLAEERPVPAVVLDHEQPDQEAGGRHGQDQAEPVAVAQAQQHDRPEREERHRGDHQLVDAAHRIGVTVAGEDLQPLLVVSRRRRTLAVGGRSLQARACPTRVGGGSERHSALHRSRRHAAGKPAGRSKSNRQRLAGRGSC